MSRFIILDRDGVINSDSLNYIKSVDEFHLIPGSLDAIARLTAAGYTIGVATNQSGVSRGLYTEAVLQAIHQKLIKAVNETGGRIDAIEYCIHLPEDLCACRKPKPGMLLALAKKLGHSLNGVSFVGDRLTDIEAAVAAQANPVIVLSSMTDLMGLKSHPSVPVFNSLSEYVDQLLSAEHG